MGPPKSRIRVRRAPLALVAAACASLALAACSATGSSTGDFKGAAAGAAEAISNLQSDATANDAKKICERDLSKAIKERLSANSSTCVGAIENQLGEVDTFHTTVEDIRLTGKGTSADAKVKSTWNGKQKNSTLKLVKEGGSWKVAGLETD